LRSHTKVEVKARRKKSAGRDQLIHSGAIFELIASIVDSSAFSEMKYILHLTELQYCCVVLHNCKCEREVEKKRIGEISIFVVDAC
jgi:hypothetical protein